MPLITAPDDQAPLPMSAPPQITKPEFRGIAVDSEITPESALITHIQGAPQSVTYYGQIIDEDSGLAGTSGGIATPHQQYRRYRNMVLMVSSDLSYSQDQETKESTYTGSGTLYPFVIPNEGDMFVGDLRNGNYGIFEITTTRRMSVYKQTCYEVDYKLVRDATPTAVAELDQKTHITFYYDKNYLDHGQNPILFEEEYHIVTKLRQKYLGLVRNYIQMFFSREYSTILVGGQTTTTYDPKLVRFLLHLLSVNEAPEMGYIRSLNTENDIVLDSLSLWDAFMRRDDVVGQACTHVGVTSAKNFSVNPMLESIYFSGIDRVVYPLNHQSSVDLAHTFVAKAITGPLESADHSMFSDNGETGSSYRSRIPLDIEFVLAEGPLPAFDNVATVHPNNRVLFHPIDPEGFYVLSGYFYRNGLNDGARQSTLEVQLYNFLNYRALDIHAIYRLVESIESMKPLERTYLVPLILLLLRQRIFITV